MPGIRLHHPTLRAAEGSMLTAVIELGQPYKKGYYDCPECGKRHERKALHLRLDANGDVIVAKRIYDQLKRNHGGTNGLTRAGLELAGEVASPPTLAIGAVDKDKARIIEVPLNLDTATTYIAPGTTRHEGERKLLAPLQPAFDAAAERKDRKASKAKSRTIIA